MTTVTLPNVGIVAGYSAGESGWSASMNHNLRILDALVNLRVLDKDLTAPPGSPAVGSAYIVGAAATGAWVGQAAKLAIWCAGDDLSASEWAFVTPKTGWRAFAVDEGVDYIYNGSVWVTDSGDFASFSTSFGDGTSASYTITHNLGTRNLHVTVFRNASPWDEVVCDNSRTTTNTITLSGFVVPPSTNQFTVVVSK